MLRATMLAILLLGLSACGGYSHTMTECRGSFVPANPGKWTPGDLK